MDLKEDRMRKLNQVTPNPNNIWFYWDGPCEGDRRQQLYDAVFSTRGYNPTRPIFLVSNTWQQEKVLTDIGVEVIRWDDTIYDLFPNGDRWRPLYNAASARDRCDLLRFLFLKGWGGSYIDSDDMAIRPIPEVTKKTHNIVCRSYDPHTCHYDGNTPEMCLPGHLRGKPEFDHIPIFPRTDVWLNHLWNNSPIVNHLLEREEHDPDLGINTIYSYHNTKQVSWQTMILRSCQDLLNLHGREWHLEMTLLYLYESHVANCSYWDQGRYGGELHQIWPESQPPHHHWGQQRFTRQQFELFKDEALQRFPKATHLWLHDKGDYISDEWNARHQTMLFQLNLLSTYWIEETRNQFNIPHV